MDILNRVDTQKVTAWRRHFHMYPEVAYAEYESTKYIVNELANYPEVEVLRPTETGVVAVLKGANPGKTVALRADFDALPITEETDVPFASKNPGKMHACGHDCHAAMLLGAVDVLYKMKDEWNGTVKFIFQHAEELAPGGASQIIPTGVLDDVDVFYGTHVSMEDHAGTVGGAPGPIYANADSFDIFLQGRGAHAARPDMGIDTLLVGTEIVNALQTVISRNVPSWERAVLTIASFNAGTAYNIIPDTAHIKGTARTYTPEIRELLQKRINDIVQGICTAHGAEGKVNYRHGYAAVVNDEELYKFFKELVAEVLPDVKVTVCTPTMGGEDFSAYRAIAPIFFSRVGGRPLGDEVYGGHHPKYRVDEGVLPIGTALYAGFALRFLQK
jgi:amidohydrolase